MLHHHLRHWHHSSSASPIVLSFLIEEAIVPGRLDGVLGSERSSIPCMDADVEALPGDEGTIDAMEGACCSTLCLLSFQIVEPVPGVVVVMSVLLTRLIVRSTRWL